MDIVDELRKWEEGVLHEHNSDEKITSVCARAADTIILLRYHHARDAERIAALEREIEAHDANKKSRRA